MADDRLAFFEKKIRPVLVQRCYQCHSTDAEEVGGKLLLDSRDGMLGGGESGPVINLSSPDESLLLQALRWDGIDMPPDEPLPPPVIKDFETWIAMGAADPRDAHAVRETSAAAVDRESLWSFYPRSKPQVPVVQDSQWPQDPIDHFALASMEAAGLSPTQDADAETLGRRLYYDLIGLPPTRTQLESFVRQCETDRQLAVERLVDTLLGSQQFGVRWGRHWLDVARYGESNGDDGLGRNATFPHAWRYRDYVVDAFNSDVPYDRFLTEQIAGDLLPAETAEQRNRQLVATGFLAIGSKPAVAMNQNFAMDVVDDQINAVCTAAMGLSVACARCHDHKHDPIPTRDYYALAGIFASTQTLYGAAGNEKLTAPPTPLHELKSDWNPDQKPVDRTAPPQFPADYNEIIDRLAPAIHEKFNAPPQALIVPSEVTYSATTFATVKETTISGKLQTVDPSYSVSLWFFNRTNNDARPITAYLFSRAKLGDKSLPGGHLGIGGNHDKTRTGRIFVFNGNGAKQSTVGTTVIPPKTWNHVTLVRNGKHVKVFLNGRLEVAGELPHTFGETEDFCVANRSDNFAALDGHLGQFALFPRALSDEEASQLHAASGQPRGLPPMPPSGLAMGVRDKSKPTDCKVHINGEGGKLGPVVPRGALTAYQSFAPENDFATAELALDSGGSGRAALAAWLTDPNHPQTARVMTNRIWMHLFGRGLVTTPDDFGVYGARPSHPELLDHLAQRLVDQGWSMKRFIRSIILSRTYQLDSRCEPETASRDPECELLTHHARRRLDAEALRDSMLQASGAIDYAPASGSAIEQVDSLINWPPGEATDLHRKLPNRSIYLCMLRHAPPKELVAFDLPDGVGIAGQRETSTLPTQTLFLLNSDFVVEQADTLAGRLLENQSIDDHQRLDAMFSAILHRGPGDDETSQTLSFVRQIERQLADELTEPDRRIRKAWATVCQALLMTNEFRYVD
ncbi:DUF1553 domain-containing protein [Neorhodopirellula pilleata]|uniref:Planctomycete cytochrome C n=1 Tax=Neorhodopirellula pilleata TaxID=2714738 RepID=A0A5C6AQH2_9BACT|nr:DUF1553 domain-containing protein [Neorhodopirellula pilleata]TWU01701.1 Planctomycete cytochrome C [Neorhodopirellula pilleata]